MKAKLACSIISVCCFFHTIWAQQAIPADANAFYQKAIQQINPKHIAWIKSTAADPRNKQINEQGIRNLVNSYSKGLNFSTMDIDALVSLVMMQISKDEEQDLKSQLDAIKKNNEEKKKLLDAMNQLQMKRTSWSRSVIDSFHSMAIKPKINAGNKNTVVKASNISNTVSQDEINSLQVELKGKLDSMNEMGQTESLRLQMAMDRRSKLMDTLSNIMKKLSDTQNTVIQNLK